MKLPIRIVVVAGMLAATLANVNAQAAWTGWARCVIDIAASGYHSRETHTWLIGNVTMSSGGVGSWHVSGRGNLLKDDGVTRWQAEWAINGQKSGIAFRTVSSGSTIAIRQYDSQVSQQQGIAGYSQQSISGSARKPEKVTGSQWEWQFPRVEGPIGNRNLTGSSNGSFTHGWGWNGPYGGTRAASCTWTFLDGATPPPPPPIPPEAVPTGPSAQPGSVRAPG